MHKIVTNLREFIGSKRDLLQKTLIGLQWFILRLVGNIPSQYIRLFIYKNFFGLKAADKVVIYGGTEFRCPENINISSNTIIGNNSILDGRAGITIGSNVNFSSEVAIWTVQHDPQDANFDVKFGSVTIKDYAWISFRSVILPGVTIGQGGVVAACAVVTKDVEPYTIVAGIPAKPIGKRSMNLRYKLGDSFFPFI